MTAADIRYYREGWTPARMDCCGRLALDYDVCDMGDDSFSLCKSGRGCMKGSVLRWNPRWSPR